MALATKCPHCHTVFRVALDQLKLRGGIVRCGACNEIFDGNAALVEPSASVAGAAIPVLLPAAAVPAGLDLELDLDEVLVRQERPAPPPKPGPTPDGHAPAPLHAREIDDDEIDDNEIDNDRDLHLTIPAAADEPEREPEPEPDSPAIASDRREPAFDMPSEHIVAIALDELHHFDDEPAIPSPSLIDTSAAAHSTSHATSHAANEAAERTADDAAAADLLTAAPESALLAAGAGFASAPARPGAPGMQDEADLPGDEPEFVRQAERRERTQGIARLAMIAGIPLLALVLVAQGVHTLRNSLTASYPAMKPALQALCVPLGCTVGLPRQIDALAIAQGELQTLAPNTYSFATVLRNGSRSAQAWPHIELVLNDAADKPVLRRVFAPRDYLARPADVAQGFGPRSEQPVKLYFQLDRLRASGYHIAIFHP